MELEHALRGVLAAEAAVVVLLFGSFFGAIWHERGWPIRVISMGLHAVLVYVFVAQIKAFNLDIPFDGYSVVGLAAETLLLTGLVWFVRDRRYRRGR